MATSKLIKNEGMNVSIYRERIQIGYCMHTFYHLVKNDVVVELQKKDFKQVKNDWLTYANNGKKIELSMELSENKLLVRFRDCKTKASVDSVVPFDYNKDSEHNNS
ncbi:hypothetical protein I4U23_013157 [Adineta vaga]|nr:hypothetical protein I4U23_013157 [Adineta vaga]